MSLFDQGALAFLRDVEPSFLETTTTLTADAGETPAYAYYSKPSDLFILKGLEYLGDQLFLRTEDQLRREYGDWRSESDRPYFFVVREAHFQMVPYSTDTLTIYCTYIRRPVATATNGSIDLPDDWQLAAMNWAIDEYLTQNDDFRDPGKAARYGNTYREIVEKAQAYSAIKGVRQPRRIGRRVP